MDDRELLDEFVKARSQGAFRELVERHLPVVYSAARRMVRDSHLAEEVAQSVFTMLAQKADSIRPPQVLGGWLYNTTRHLAMHAVRTEQRRREREQTAFAMQSFEPTPDDSEINEHLEPALAELDAEDRDALVLRFLANRGLREVGVELGVSEEAARKRVSRALDRLRVVLANRGVTSTSVLLATALTASTIAVPVGLGAAISTTALAGAAFQTSAAVAATKAIAMTTLQKSLIAGALALVLSGGVGTYLVVQHSRVAGPPATAVAAAPATAADANIASADSISGILKTPDGKPLPNAEVILSTASAAVAIYAAPSPEVVATVTGRDGRFSFPASSENRAVIVVNDKGYGQATVAELTARAELTLQPWAQVKGTLRKGATPLANQTIHLSRTRFGSKLQEQAYRTVHDTKTKTDAAGHYSFPRVAPGDAWISWRTDQGGYDLQYRYFDIQAGQSLTADIGGRGRPVIGRAVLADSDAPVKFFGSVWPRTSHQMRRPPNWSQLSPEDQAALTVEWEKTPDAKLYNQERCPIDFRLAADGTFTVPDLPVGDYRITVASWSDAPVTSRMMSRGTAEFTIVEMPTGRSDQPFDAGEITAYSTEPLRAGNRAPLFEANTFDGRRLKLADYQGKHVLLNFWRGDDAKSMDDMPDLKTTQAAWGKDQRLILIGFSFDDTLAAARQYATNNGLTWTQCFLGKTSDMPMRYRLRRPTSVLIGPDGLILHSDLRGPAIATALEDALGAK
jgi:RNA polymerase sigma factor (sigma-70 family)